jgi:hypothetical protein
LIKPNRDAVVVKRIEILNVTVKSAAAIRMTFGLVDAAVDATKAAP